MASAIARMWLIPLTVRRPDDMQGSDPQATRLGGIVHADLIGAPATKHKSVSEGYTVGLGPGHGLVWSRTWGVDIMITGKLAYKVKSFMWNYSSMVR